MYRSRESIDFGDGEEEGQGPLGLQRPQPGEGEAEGGDQQRRSPSATAATSGDTGEHRDLRCRACSHRCARPRTPPPTRTLRTPDLLRSWNEARVAHPHRTSAISKSSPTIALSPSTAHTRKLTLTAFAKPLPVVTLS